MASIYLTKKIYDYYNIGIAKNKTKHNNKKKTTTRKNKRKSGGDPNAQQPVAQPSPAQPAQPAQMSQYMSCWALPYVQGKCTKKDANGYPGGTEKCSFFDYLGYLIYTDKCYYKTN